MLSEYGEIYQFGGSNMFDKSNLPGDLNDAYKVKGLEGKNFVQISCGNYHCAAIDSNGDLYTWGGGKTP